MADEHVHEFIHPQEVWEADGVTHHRVLTCECGATEDAPEPVEEPEDA